MNNDSLEARYRSVIEDNVNVSKQNDGVEFLILLAGVFVFCFSIYFCADSIAGFYIDRMSNEKREKIEVVLAAFKPSDIEIVSDTEQIARLSRIRDKIVRQDKKLQSKSNFELFVVKDDTINAFISPSGAIYFTTGILKQDFVDDEVLTFVMAHELGHYVYRDALKAISSTLIVSTIQTVLMAGQSSELSTVMTNFSYLSGLTYSKRQERRADWYAAHMLKRLYGNTHAATVFFEEIRKKEEFPEFFHYFSTHPATSERIELVKKLK